MKWRKEGEGENRKGEMEEGGGREVRVGWGGRHSTDSSICERNLKCTDDARHCLTHIFTEVSIDCQL